MKDTAKDIIKIFAGIALATAGTTLLNKAYQNQRSYRYRPENDPWKKKKLRSY